MPDLDSTTDAHAAKVLVATTAMLAYISFWRAAAVVLNDMGSSAFYAGAIAEHFVGKTAPWFILAIMLLSYAVRSVYIESCSMFVRGGVYRVVKEAMGGTLAKFSVSALMFDYILTGPISGVSAGLYLTGLLNELFGYAHFNLVLPMNWTGGILCGAGDDLFLVGKHQGHPRVEREGAAHHVRHHGDGGHHDRRGAATRLMVRGAHSSAAAAPGEPALFGRCAGLAEEYVAAVHRRLHRHFDRPGPLRPGDERRRDDGAGLPRDRASEAEEPGEGRVRDFHLTASSSRPASRFSP